MIYSKATENTQEKRVESVVSADELIFLWRESNAIRAIDEQWVRSLMHHSQESDTAVLLAGVLCSAYLGMGHVCLYLDRVLESPFLTASKDDISLWKQLLSKSGIHTLKDWKKRLSLSALVQIDNRHFNSEATALTEAKATPLILSANRLYLTRYFHYEEQVYQFLKTSSQADMFEVDKTWLDEVFPRPASCSEVVDWQKVAVASAAAQRFSVISGGPGTGKTTTVIKLLALLVQQANAHQLNLTIKLTAPTGKAAARLTESISKAKENLPVAQSIKDAIPERASTLHRLLGASFGRSEFKFNAQNPLHLDVLLVDEASMVDLPMMAKLISALPSHARLVLLGDKDQLSSVEAGGVLGDLTAGIDQLSFACTWTDYLSKMLNMDFSAYSHSYDTRKWMCQHLTLLKKSYRFDGSSGIGQLASAVNQGDEKQAMRVLYTPPDGSIEWYVTQGSVVNGDAKKTTDPKIDIAALGKGYAEYWQGVRSGVSIDTLFSLFAHYQVLCAVRQGDLGVEAINEGLRQYFYQRGYLNLDQIWEPGKAIMIRRNDASLGLFNGDIGICMPDAVDTTKMRVWFQLSDGSIKGILPSRLSEYELVYAMTVHKSQGSEFDNVVLVLPEKTGPVLTKELLYTGITRAKRRFSLWGNETVLRHAISNKVVRLSGLQNKIGSSLE